MTDVLFLLNDVTLLMRLVIIKNENMKNYVSYMLNKVHSMSWSWEMDFEMEQLLYQLSDS